VKDELQRADFAIRRDIIRALVKRIEVDEQQIRIAFRVGPMPVPLPFDRASHHWQDCGRREHPGRLEGHMGAACSLKPIDQAEQIRGEGGETLELFVRCAVLAVADQTGDDKPLVDIESTTTPVKHLHRRYPPW
jgi:hypothetical protein